MRPLSTFQRTLQDALARDLTVEGSLKNIDGIAEQAKKQKFAVNMNDIL
jgi:hypothetical protein